MTHKKDLNWLRRNKKYLRLSAIADELKIKPQNFRGAINEEYDSHGTPFKVPAKYHEALAELIKKIKK